MPPVQSTLIKPGDWSFSDPRGLDDRPSGRTLSSDVPHSTSLPSVGSLRVQNRSYIEWDAKHHVVAQFKHLAVVLDMTGDSLFEYAGNINAISTPSSSSHALSDLIALSPPVMADLDALLSLAMPAAQSPTDGLANLSKEGRSRKVSQANASSKVQRATANSTISSARPVKADQSVAASAPAAQPGRQRSSVNIVQSIVQAALRHEIPCKGIPFADLEFETSIPDVAALRRVINPVKGNSKQLSHTKKSLLKHKRSHLDEPTVSFSALLDEFELSEREASLEQPMDTFVVPSRGATPVGEETRDHKVVKKDKKKNRKDQEKSRCKQEDGKERPRKAKKADGSQIDGAEKQHARDLGHPNVRDSKVQKIKKRKLEESDSQLAEADENTPTSGLATFNRRSKKKKKDKSEIMASNANTAEQAGERSAGSRLLSSRHSISTSHPVLQVAEITRKVPKHLHGSRNAVSVDSGHTRKLTSSVAALAQDPKSYSPAFQGVKSRASKVPKVEMRDEEIDELAS